MIVSVPAETKYFHNILLIIMLIIFID